MSAPHPENQLNGRDAEVVQAIEEEGLSKFTFDGIRRITGTHPETLSRSLERLEFQGIIVKSSEGYATTVKTRELVALKPAYSLGKKVPILHTYLPPGAKSEAVASALKGRWFDRMRWVGVSETEEGPVLKWVTEDGRVLIDARFSDGELDIDAKLKTDADLAVAVRAAHQLMGRISHLYSSNRPGGRVMQLSIGYFPSAM